MSRHMSVPGDDPVLRNVVGQYGMPKWQIRKPGFASMVHIILEQQVSISSAKACYNKIEAALGSIAPDRILQATPDLFRSCGVSRQKAYYICNMAEMHQSGDLNFDSLSRLTGSEAKKELMKIKGVGNWS